MEHFYSCFFFCSLTDLFLCVYVWGRCREEDESAMVFVSSELGEHSITTRDIDVNENTIVQFEVRGPDALQTLLLHITHNQFSDPVIVCPP